MDPDTAAAFQRLKEADPSNKRCLECDAPEPQWCALSYGAFVCLNCSGLHRGLGVHLSFVRSSTMDAWQPQQLKLMECGGNSKCKNFFVEYGVWDLPFKERYATKAAAYYRALLRSSAEGGWCCAAAAAAGRSCTARCCCCCFSALFFFEFDPLFGLRHWQSAAAAGAAGL
uniref:Arf-GAP domain-containing protein n=1 Tax=Eimeria tenella TaxID=5802 RepID=H9B994_EIMTE|nr:hypothetical protein [Eimeria tenella]